MPPKLSPGAHARQWLGAVVGWVENGGGGLLCCEKWLCGMGVEQQTDPPALRETVQQAGWCLPLQRNYKLNWSFSCFGLFCLFLLD